MKNQNQVRKNGSAPRAARQAKTIAKNVTFVFTENETGEIAAKFEVPKSFHDAMIRDALEKGISLQQWVENAVTEQTAKFKPKPDAPVNGDDEISLVLFSAQKNTLAQIELTPAEFQKIQFLAKIPLRGCSLKSVLEDMLHRVTTEIPTTELEFAVTEAKSLLDLLANHMEWISKSGIQFEGLEADTFCAGVTQLADNTKKRLYDAFRSTHSAIFGKRETVSAAA